VGDGNRVVVPVAVVFAPAVVQATAQSCGAGDGNQKEKWQCLQGWFVNNGSGEFGLLHHLNFSKGHYDKLVDA